MRDDAVVQPVVEAAGRIMYRVHFCGEPIDGQLPVGGRAGRDGERRTDEPGVDGLGRCLSRAPAAAPEASAASTAAPPTPSRLGIGFGGRVLIGLRGAGGRRGENSADGKQEGQ